ncbi:serine hydrolase [Spirosoma taeanense]|uniref:Serine hydrolase n=1 Tax=Spirosoma taeanense TaxID=2735870 RepID=A0A6M5YB78_9BACT|nr:serine hydrolase [Spirosoma taeanense]QJW91245.1 serine hydrolase [Spirosoma taeanense]
MKTLLLLLLFIVSIVASAQKQPAFISDSLDSYVKRGMADWQIPGLAIAIVKDGKAVISKGYGVREVGQNEPVDENTLFFIATNSKLFTGSAMARLEDEKKLSLNDKVTKYLPDYKLYDPAATQLVTVRDLLCHRLGTKTFQGDFTFWDSNLSRAEIVRRMRLLKPEGQFRQDYGYCNSGFVTAGEVLQKVTGQTWEQYIESNIVKPLGMTNTYMLTAGAENRPNIARPYTTSFGSLTRIPYDNIDNMAPAGSIVSCVKDLSKWLLMQLDSGRFEGKRVLPWPVIQKTRDANTLLGSRKSSVFPTHVRAYGLGVLMTDYNGREVYWHTGGAFGFVTNTCFVPEEKLAITILTNQDNQSFFEALRYQILDAYLGVPYTNRSQFFLTGARRDDAQQQQELKALAERVARKAKPELPLAAYTGTYRHELYGTISIQPDGTGLKVSFQNHPNLSARLDHMDDNTFRLTYSNQAFGVFPAKFSTKGSTAESVVIKASDFVEYDPYVFVKL